MQERRPVDGEAIVKVIANLEARPISAAGHEAEADALRPMRCERIRLLARLLHRREVVPSLKDPQHGIRGAGASLVAFRDAAGAQMVNAKGLQL